MTNATTAPLEPPLGLLLAAGAGTRMGTPKALVRDEGGVPWLERAVRLLLEAGCSPVVVVLGAAADAARELLPDDARVTAVVADDWQRGMSASLTAGINAAIETDAAAAVITLVDLPDLPLAALLRLLGSPPADVRALRQARYDGRPGHPVVIGRSHWAPLIEQLSGDEGARRYLAEHGAEQVDCSDLGDGIDVNEPRG